MVKVKKCEEASLSLAKGIICERAVIAYDLVRFVIVCYGDPEVSETEALQKTIDLLSCLLNIRKTLLLFLSVFDVFDYVIIGFFYLKVVFSASQTFSALFRF